MKESTYFPHFSAARNDRKIRRLRKELNIEGYGIYFMIIEVLREQQGFKYPLSDIDLLADEFGTSEPKIKAVIGNYDLFSIDENQMFFSNKLHEFMKPLFVKRQQRILAGKASGQKRRLLLESKTTVQQPLNETSTTVEQPLNESSTTVERALNENEQSKVKLSKVKLSKEKLSKENNIKKKNKKDFEENWNEEGFEEFEKIENQEIPKNGSIIFKNRAEIETELLSSTHWLESVCMATQKQFNEVTASLIQFLIEQDAKENIFRPLSEIKTHFVNALKKQQQNIHPNPKSAGSKSESRMEKLRMMGSTVN